MSSRCYARSTRKRANTSASRQSSTTPGCVPRPFHPSAIHLTALQGLIKSFSRNEQQEGVRLLSEIFRNSRERRRECLYYLALGNYKLGNYAEARRYNELLLELEPANLQAGSLKDLIDDKVAKEGLVGVAIVGGIAVAAGIVGSFLLKGARRR
jgi:fission 1 protein